jgi:hypothetical protein
VPKDICSDPRDVATGNQSVYIYRHAHDGYFLLATHPSLPQRKRAGRKKYETGGGANCRDDGGRDYHRLDIPFDGAAGGRLAHEGSSQNLFQIVR